METPPTSDQSWIEYRRLVLGELERLGNRIEQNATKLEITTNAIIQRIDMLQATQIAELRLDLVALKTKSGMFGGMMGALTGLAVAIGGALLQRFH